MSNMEVHEHSRDRQLERMKTVIDEKVKDEDLKDAFYEVYDTVALVSSGVDDAHKRLDIRKDEIKELTKEVSKLTKVVTSTYNSTIDTNHKTKRNSKVAMIATLISCFLPLFMIFGGVEALQKLGFIVTVVKTLDVVV